MTALRISLVEGLHLTATNRRHLAHIIGQGWSKGESGRLAYTVEPIDPAQGLYRYQIGRMERDDWGRPQYRIRKGVVQAI